MQYISTEDFLLKRSKQVNEADERETRLPMCNVAHLNSKGSCAQSQPSLPFTKTAITSHQHIAPVEILKILSRHVRSLSTLYECFLVKYIGSMAAIGRLTPYNVTSKIPSLVSSYIPMVQAINQPKRNQIKKGIQLTGMRSLEGLPPTLQ